MSREELGDAIADNPRLIPLVTRVLYAAGMNGHDRTLAAMAIALGDAVGDRDHLSEVELILAALADLGAEHVILMEAFDAIGGAPEFIVPGNSGLSKRVVSLCLANLVSRGLVKSERVAGQYATTELGRVVLRCWPSGDRLGR
jgi:hypothetical protein